MTTFLKPLAIVFSLMFTSSAIAEDAKPAEWLFVHTAASAEMTSDTTLVMPVTREIFMFTDRPKRQHRYMNAHEFVSLWDEGDGDTFKADPPNAVLTWVDGAEVKEAELLITNASVVGHGRSVAYEVKFEAGEAPGGDLSAVSLFVDGVPGICAGSALCLRERLMGRFGRAPPAHWLWVCSSRPRAAYGAPGGLPQVTETQ